MYEASSGEEKLNNKYFPVSNEFHRYIASLFLLSNTFYGGCTIDRYNTTTCIWRFTSIIIMTSSQIFHSMVSHHLIPRNASFEENFKIKKIPLKTLKDKKISKDPTMFQYDINENNFNKKMYKRQLCILKNYEKSLIRRRKEEYLTQFAIICFVFIGLILSFYFLV